MVANYNKVGFFFSGKFPKTLLGTFALLDFLRSKTAILTDTKKFSFITVSQKVASHIVG